MVMTYTPPPGSQQLQQPIDWTQFTGIYSQPQGSVQNSPFGYGQLTSFGTNNNLLNQQVNPTQSPDLQQAQNQTMLAAQRASGFQTPQFSGVPSSQYGQYTQGANNYLNQAGMSAQNLANIPQFSAISQQNAAMPQNYLQQAGMELGNAQVGGYGQINASQDPRVRQIETQQMNAYSPFTPSAESTEARQLTSQALGNLAGAPSRQDLALEALKLFDEEQGDVRKLGTQQIGQDAARLGRLGSGMVTTDLSLIHI